MDQRLTYLRGRILPVFEHRAFAQTCAETPSADLGRRPEPAAIRRAAQLGDAWHLVSAVPATPLEPEELKENVATLRELTERAGRVPEAVEVVMKVPLYDVTSGDGGPRRRFSGGPEEIAEDIRTYADIGVSELIFDVRSEELSQTLERLAWLAEEVATLV